MNIIKINPNVKNSVNGKKDKDNTKINFTKAAIDNLPLPPEGMRKKYYKDEKVKGLWLYITDYGTKCFQVRKRVSGLLKTYVIGEYPYISVPNARSKAFEVISDWINIDAGIKPAPITKEEVDYYSVKDVIEVYINKHLKLETRTQSQYILTKLYNNWEKLGDKNIYEVTKKDMLEFREKITPSGKIGTNRTMAFLRAAFNYFGNYIVPNDRIGGFSNPASSLPQYKEIARKRYIEEDEFPRFFTALLSATEDIRDLIFLALITGSREFPLRAMQWSELQLNNKTINKWIIPGDKQKNGESHEVPLISAALKILNRRKQQQNKDNIVTDYVFYAPKSQYKFIQEPKRQWHKVTKLAGLYSEEKERNLRFHDLRHTIATWQVRCNVNVIDISATLSHKFESQSVTGIYARATLESIKLAIEKAYDAMIKNTPQDIIDKIINADME